MANLFLAIKTFKRLGALAIISAVFGSLLLMLGGNALVGITREKSKPFELQATGEDVYERLEQIGMIKNVVAFTPAIELNGEISTGEYRLNTEIVGINSIYLNEDIEKGDMFPDSSAMPYIVLNDKATESFMNKNQIYVKPDSINWLNTQFKINLSSESTIISKVSGILKAPEKPLDEKEETNTEAIGDEGISAGISGSGDLTMTGTATTVQRTQITPKSSKAVKANTEKSSKQSKKNDDLSKTTSKKSANKTSKSSDGASKDGVNTDVPTGNEEVVPDGEVSVPLGGEVADIVEGEDVPKAYISIDAAKKIGQLNDSDISKVLIKVRSFGKQESVSKELENMGITATNTDDTLIEAWKTKTEQSFYLLFAGAVCMMTTAIIIWKNTDIDLMTHKNEYINLRYMTLSKRDILSYLTLRAAIIIVIGGLLGLVAALAFPWLLSTGFREDSIYAYEMSINAIAIIGVFECGIVFSLYLRLRISINRLLNCDLEKNN